MSDIKKKPIEHKIILDNIDDITNINEDIILEIPDETFSEGEELLFEQDENHRNHQKVRKLSCASWLWVFIRKC